MSVSISMYLECSYFTAEKVFISKNEDGLNRKKTSVTRFDEVSPFWQIVKVLGNFQSVIPQIVTKFLMGGKI